MTTDTSEKGLEDLITRAMTGRTDLLVPPHVATETSVPVAGGTGWLLGDPAHYDREYCVDLTQLHGFLLATQEELLSHLQLLTDGPTRRKFLARLQGEISKRGTIDVLRHGIKHGPLHLDLFYGTPSPGNPKAAQRFAQNRFSVTRQLRYSRDETQRALDLAFFVTDYRWPPSNSKTISPNKLSRTQSTNTNGTAIRARNCSSLVGAWSILRLTIRKFVSALISPAKPPGFYPSTKAGTTAPRRTLADASRASRRGRSEGAGAGGAGIPSLLD